MWLKKACCVKRSRLVDLKLCLESEYSLDRVAESVHIGRRHTGDVDPPGTDNVDRVFFAKLCDLLLAES